MLTMSRSTHNEKLSKLIDTITAAAGEHSTPLLIAGGATVAATLIYKTCFSGTASLLQNKDSVLKRNQVKNSMDDYDDLFTGARKNVGSLHDQSSIQKREKEYKTMINNFYDLVTDFYEWGWGQVRACIRVEVLFML